MCGCGTCLEFIVLLIITQFFVNFLMVFPWHGLVCELCGVLLEKKQNLLPGINGFARLD